jgi:hypothetical protein
VSLVVHALLYAGFNTRDQLPFVWTCLQYAVVIGFIPQALNYLSKRLGVTKPPPPYVRGSARYEERSSWRVYGETFVGVAIVILFLYALGNYIYWDEFVLKLWHPYAIDGRYFAQHTKGTTLRSLTAEEYKGMSLYFARAGSGHWMGCHLLALALLYGD